MNARRIGALALCALLAFSGGCSLISVDEELRLEKENAKVIIEYRGAPVTKQAVTLEMNASLLNQQKTLAEMMEDENAWPGFRDGIVRQMAVFELTLDQAAALGLDRLTAEETAALDEEYAQGLADADSYLALVAQMTAGDDAEDSAAGVERYLGLRGYSAATYRKQLEREFVFEKTKAHFLSAVDVSEESVRNYYDSNLDMQKMGVDDSPAMFELQRSLGIVLYYPEGYMSVRHIFVGFDADIGSKAYAAYSDRDMALYDTLVGQGRASVAPKLDAITARLDAGESFDVLMGEYNEDPAFDSEPLKSEGFITGPYARLEIPGYLDAVSGLNAEGAYTVSFSYLGAHIIRCEKLLGGEVPYGDVRDDLHASLLRMETESEWSTLTQAWLDAAVADGTLKMYASRY